MDKNQATGLILISVMLIGYWIFFKPDLPPPEDLQETAKTEMPISEEVLEASSSPSLPDSVTSVMNTDKFGVFSAASVGTSNVKSFENDQLKISFNTKGARISEVILKKFKSKDGNPVQLLTESSSEFSTLVTSFGKTINLNELYYNESTRNTENGTVVTFTANLGEGKSVKHTYTVPKEGYEIGYKLDVKGLDNAITKDEVIFQWNDHMITQETDVNMSRQNSTVNYYTVENGFDELTERSTSLEEETVNESIKWVTIKQRFFLSAIIAENSFSKGKFTTNVDDANPEVVKYAEVTLSVPFNDVKEEKADYKYYFGPNDYHITSDVTEDFSKNLFLGWPPMLWVNKFILIPLFYFLSSFIGNYGIIIILIVLIIKLVLSPLSYKSYLSMAKMKVLKPELDEIKEKHEGDMSKAQSEQMKLYQQVGVNPISGCVPMLLQMPILLAMFYFFPQSIELRGESFLWATDLSTFDSIFDLPFEIPFYGSHVSLFVLLMTISTIMITYSQQQVSTVQGPMKSLSYMMPVIFMFVLNSYPAALSFYYFISNLVTFGQQMVIRKFVDEDKIRKILDENKKNSGTKTKSKFQQRLEDAMKAQGKTKGKK
jgi:YidC/Oxa1 family membrane protein insertase